MSRRDRGKPKAILFDLDDTLVFTCDADAAAYAAVRESAAARLSADPSTVSRLEPAFRRLLKAVPWDPSGAHDTHSWREGLWERAWSHAAEEEVFDTDAAARHPGDAPHGSLLYRTWFETRIARFRMPPEHEALLRDLRAGGYGIALITNGDSLTQRAKLEACGAAAHFEVILVGHEEEAPKPAPAIFHKAARAAGFEPGECVMIGDSLRCDVGGAAAADLHSSVWVAGRGRDAAEMEAARVAADPPPDYAVRTVLELPALLERML